VRQVAIVLLLLTTTLFAAGDKKKKPTPPYAVVAGSVFDAEGRSVRGLKITIRRADEKKPRWEVVSDARGDFAQRVPAGRADYIVRPELKDKQAAENAEVKVHIENEEQQSVALHLTEQELRKK
jgi:hypothetical protein